MIGVRKVNEYIVEVFCTDHDFKEGYFYRIRKNGVDTVEIEYEQMKRIIFEYEIGTNVERVRIVTDKGDYEYLADEVKPATNYQEQRIWELCGGLRHILGDLRIIR